jgi:ADP-heptose:LPS heptosyltransferase
MGFAQYYDFLYHKCAAMVSIDSAPLHIGRALGLPMLSFWGPTNPHNYLAPRAHAADHAVYLQAPCSPCVHFTEQLPCGGDNFCMKDITPLDIANQLASFLAHVALP